MPRRHNVIMHDRVTLTAGGVAIEKDMPINPISFLTITLRALNSVANTIPTATNLLGAIANLEVLLDGKTLVGGSLADLAHMALALWGTYPITYPITKTDNNVLNMMLHIPFARRPWMQEEGLPTTRKGDLTLKITPAAAYTNFDTATITVEARQILDQVPKRFLKYTTSTKTPAATGEHEIDLLTGPDYVGVLFYSTTVPTTNSQNASIAKLKMKIDDVEQMLPETRWESLFGEWSTRPGWEAIREGHVHISDLGAAYAQYQDAGIEQHAATKMRNYLYVDFDPDKSLAWRLITRGRSRAHFVITADVADQIWMLPCEVVSLVEEQAAA